jgi:hypothetical protein
VKRHVDIVGGRKVRPQVVALYDDWGDLPPVIIVAGERFVRYRNTTTYNHEEE